MLPDQVSNPGPLTYESGALPIALRGPANRVMMTLNNNEFQVFNTVAKAVSCIYTIFCIHEVVLLHCYSEADHS